MYKESLRLMAGEGLTLQQMGDTLGISKQRIHQLLSNDGEAKALWDRARYERTEAKASDSRKKAARKYNRMSSKEFYSDNLRKQQSAKLSNLRSTCRKYNRTCDLEWADIEWPTYCPALGIELDYFNNERQDNSPSFDRVNPIAGYTKDNVRIISWRANRIKNNGTANEHRYIADYIDENMRSCNMHIDCQEL